VHITFCVHSLHVWLQTSAAEDGGFSQCLKAAHDFFKVTQISENPPEYENFYQQMSKIEQVIFQSEPKCCYYCRGIPI